MFEGDIFKNIANKTIKETCEYFYHRIEVCTQCSHSKNKKFNYYIHDSYGFYIDINFHRNQQRCEPVFRFAVNI